MTPEDRQRAQGALRIWDRASDVRGTAGEYYLAMRGLALPGELDGEVVRFLPECPRQGGTCPALVVLFRRMEGDTPVAIQRIYITPDFKKLQQPMMLGPVAGAAMKLTSHRATCCGAANFYAPVLHVCEGFETGLALLQLGYAPVWALGSAGAVERLPLLWFVGRVVVAFDNDESKAGERAAAAVKLTWGWRASAITTSAVGTDFADLVAAQAAEHADL